MSCGSCGPRPRLPWSRRRGRIRPGLCCGPSRLWARSAWRCSWPRCRRRGGFGPNGTCGAYAGLAVVTRSSAEYTIVAGQAVRRRRAPMTRGLNRNHNRVLKDVFKGAATAATARPGPLQDFYHSAIARGTREELARLTLTRKLAALTLRLWKKGERYDPTKLTTPAR